MTTPIPSHTLSLSLLSVLVLVLAASCTPKASDIPGSASPSGMPTLTVVVDLGYMMKTGDDSARDALIQIAKDVRLPRAQRDSAMSSLGQDLTEKSLVAVAELLRSPEDWVRVRAFYSLPVEVRPQQFDYTADPTAASSATVTEVIGRIQAQYEP